MLSEDADRACGRNTRRSWAAASQAASTTRAVRWRRRMVIVAFFALHAAVQRLELCTRCSHARRHSVRIRRVPRAAPNCSRPRRLHRRQAESNSSHVRPARGVSRRRKLGCASGVQGVGVIDTMRHARRSHSTFECTSRPAASAQNEPPASAAWPRPRVLSAMPASHARTSPLRRWVTTSSDMPSMSPHRRHDETLHSDAWSVPV
jgi:hypothetical protein